MNHLLVSTILGLLLVGGSNSITNSSANFIDSFTETTLDELSDRQLNRLMRNVSGNYSKEILSEPFIARASFMEKARCDGSWCMFTEGEAYLRSFGYDAPVEVQNAILIPEVIFKSDRTEAWKQKMAGYENTFPDYKYFSDTQPGYTPLLSGFRFFEQNGPLMQPGRHAFTVSEPKYQPNDAALLSVDFITDASRGSSYKGRMLINTETERVHHIDLTQVPFHSVNFFRWMNNAKSEITFSYLDGRAYVSEISTMVDHQGVEYVVSGRFSEPVIYSEEFTDRDYFNLQNQTLNPWVPKIQNLHRFESGFIEDLSDIRADLEHEKTLEQQFKANSGQPWRYNKDFDGEIHLGHGGQSVFENARKVRKELASVLE